MSGEAIDEGQGEDLLAKYRSESVDLGTCVSTADRSGMIEFVRSYGNAVAIAYSLLVACEHRVEVPQTGKGFVTLTFRDHAVTIRGVRLEPLFEAIKAQRVSRVRLLEPGTATRGSQAPLVEDLVIRRG